MGLGINFDMKFHFFSSKRALFLLVIIQGDSKLIPQHSDVYSVTENKEEEEIKNTEIPKATPFQRNFKEENTDSVFFRLLLTENHKTST